MSYNFRAVERDQQYLMPVSLRDWLPEDDLAWFVLDVVAQMDLDAIRSRYRPDGWGAAAFDPELMVALLLYAYASGERSSRRIEMRCRRDVAYRVICANQVPDHATIARFRAEHEEALGGLFGDILRLCAAAGLGRLGLVALDGTKMVADAAMSATRTAAGLDAEIAAILAEAAATDAAEDAELGPGRRGDELPAVLGDRGSRLARLQQARQQIDADEAARQSTYRQQLAQRAAIEPREARMQVRPPTRPAARLAKGNATDPDSRLMHDHGGSLQGYNGQLVVAQDGIIVAAELCQDPTDAGQLGPMLEATRASLARAGITERVGTLLADGGYWSETMVAALPDDVPELLIPPRVGRPRIHPVRWRLPARDAMRERFESPAGQALYRQRKIIVEPVFGQLKAGRGIRRFQRRGQAACRSEWKLLGATHNLLKLWRYGGRTPAPPPPRRRRPHTRP